MKKLMILAAAAGGLALFTNVDQAQASHRHYRTYGHSHADHHRRSGFGLSINVGSRYPSYGGYYSSGRTAFVGSVGYSGLYHSPRGSYGYAPVYSAPVYAAPVYGYYGGGGYGGGGYGGGGYGGGGYGCNY